MDPIYTLIMAVAVVTCGWMLRRSQQSLAVAREDRLLLGVAAFCGAMLGAKLPFVVTSEASVWSLTAWFANGKTILAGLVGGYAAVELAKWWLGIRTKTGDTFAAPVAVAIAIGRLGCFRAGCCFGTATNSPWGMPFTNSGDTTLRHPTQLYESLFHFAMAGLLVLLKQRGVFPGQLLKLYLIAYAFYRLLTETIRPEPVFWLKLTAYQWAAIGVVVAMAWLWRRDARRSA